MNATQMKRVSALDQAVMRNISVELVPGVNWREAAKEGRADMFYSVTGDIRCGDETVRATVNIGATLPDGSGIAAIGLEKAGRDGSALRLVANRGDKDHTALVATTVDAQGHLVPVIGADGLPVYAEPAIPGFDMRLGSKYLVNTDPLKTLRLKGVSLSYADAETKGGNPCAHARCEGYDIVDAPRVTAAGGALAFGAIGTIAALPTVSQAARKAVAETQAKTHAGQF